MTSCFVVSWIPAFMINWLKCLQIFVRCNFYIQSVLSLIYKRKVVLRNKLLDAVKNIDSCRVSYFKPSKTFPGVIYDLHTFVRSTPLQSLLAFCNALFVDLSRSLQKKQNHKRFVCHEEGYWTSNCPASERNKIPRINYSYVSFLLYYKKLAKNPRLTKR